MGVRSSAISVEDEDRLRYVREISVSIVGSEYGNEIDIVERCNYRDIQAEYVGEYRGMGAIL